VLCRPGYRLDAGHRIGYCGTAGWDPGKRAMPIPTSPTFARLARVAMGTCKTMYIGGGAILIILIIVLVLFFVRR
jgi:hypothetical protein